MRRLGQALIQSDWCPYKKRKLGHTERHQGALHRGKALRRNSKRMATYKPRREASEETKLAGILILDFQPPEPWENNFLLCKPPSLCGILLWQPEVTNTPWDPPLQKTPILQSSREMKKRAHQMNLLGQDKMTTKILAPAPPCCPLLQAV